MKNLVTAYLEKFKKERRMRMRLVSVLVLLAIVVGTGVYWQLRMTGSALTNEVFCGKEEHTHDDSCYELVLVCGLEESEGTAGHTHTEACYEEQTELICGQEESAAVEGHTHTDACYEEQTELTCGLEESAGHTHTEDCYDEDGNLTCGLEESAGHTHTADCYTTTKVLACGQEEREAVAGHTHTEACYQMTKILICGQEESAAVEGHTHTDECYEKQLVCGKEEHTHTVACLIDENADVETAFDWEATLPTTLSGVWADDLVAVAKSQLGYTESTANFKLADDGETRQGYTRYGAWAGNEYGDWDAMFVSFCLHYADISQDDFPEATGAYAWSVTLKNMGLYIDASEATLTAASSAVATTDASTASSADESAVSSAGESADGSADESADSSETASAAESVDTSNNAITAGDLIFFDTDDDGKIDRVGIVIGTDEGTGKLTVIEGDYAESDGDTDAVCKNEYSLSDKTIAGYGTLPEQEDAAGAESETKTEAETEIESEKESGSGNETENESESENENAAEPESETESVIESETESESGTENAGASYSSECEDYTVVVTYGGDAEISEDAVLVVEEYTSDSETYQTYYAKAAALYGWNDTEEAADAANAEEMDASAEVSEAAAEASDAGTAENAAEATNAEGTEAAAETANAGNGSEFRLFSIGLYVDGEKVEPDAPGSVAFTFHNRAAETAYAVTGFGEEDAEGVAAEFASEYSEESGDQTLQFALDGGTYYAISASTNAEADDESVEETEELTTLTAEGEDYIVTVTYGADAGLPENVELEVSEYAQDSEIYQSRYAEAAALYGWDQEDNAEAGTSEITEALETAEVSESAETSGTSETAENSEATETTETAGSEVASISAGADNETSETGTAETGTEETGLEESDTLEAEELYHGFRLFNIGLYVDGEEAEPAAAVTVTISYLGKDGMETYTVTHFGDEDTQNVDATSEYEDGSQTQTITFDADGFSDYGIALAAEEVTTYTSLSEFLFWTWNSSNTKRGTHNSIADALSYTDSDNVTWYLIPVSYLVSDYASDGYVFYESKTDSCPFYYVPNAYTTASASAATGEASYVSVTLNGTPTWYIRVQDTTGLTPHRSNVFYIPSADSVVLNLGNGNGTKSAVEYVGGTDKTGTDALRYQINDLSDYAAASTGLVTIHLPSDDDINSSDAFTVVDEVGSYEAITVSLSPESQYEYELVGWINIATGEYYDVSGGSVTAEVDLENKNVFYADWIAASYDHSGNGTLVDTADTSSFVTIRMFDYNELFDLYSATLAQTSVTSESWAVAGAMYETPILTNLVSSLTKIDNSAIVFFDTSNTTGTLENVSGRASSAPNYWTKNVSSVQNANLPYQGIVGKFEATNASSEIVTRLFDTSGGTLGVTYVGEANYLFSYNDKTGYYSYDSDSNAAVYNQSQKRFYVYDKTMNLGGVGEGGFLPYNDYTGSAYNTDDGFVNYWFGVNVELDFYLPNDAGANNGDANKVNGNDMVFEFSGDDDIWIYIDGKLVLDMGGIHSRTEGKINFSTGEVTIAEGTSYEIKISEDFTCSAGAHTMTIYYMERGASASNMKITFNIFPSWMYASADAGTMKVTKVWEDSETTHETIAVGLFEQIDINDCTVTSDSTYTYYGYDGTTYNVDTNGYSYDSSHFVNAYYSQNGYLYVRVDTKTLSDSNNWTYTWELLDESKTYEILELTTLENYITSSEKASLQSWNYWSVAGSRQLNGTVTYDDTTKIGTYTGVLTDGLEVVLTDGAQTGTAYYDLPYPTAYTGYVIIYDNNGSIATKDALFSQVATSVNNSTTTFEYGVTSDTYVSDAIWYVEMTGGYYSRGGDEV
ncbi:MAG: fibro-slime domain-containing protein [Lachnospiraceae bacterium]|nr:fibro-slime domain-containing protein [Lachnospiraceae bacterium]